MCGVRLTLIVLGIAILLEISLAQTNYCNPALCDNSVHIGCNNDGSFATTCDPSRKIMSLPSALITAIVNKHNALRNSIAGGNVAGFQPASRMSTIRWDPELSKLAVLNVKQCEMKHDACHNTMQFKYSGQNLAWSAWSGTQRTLQEVALSQIQMWFDEKKDASMTYINKLSNPTNGKVIGHFTQVVQQKSTHVGCGIMRQTKNGMTEQLMACNYASPNVLGKPVYTRAAKGASGCQTGTNPSYKFLCSLKETYAVNTL